MCSHLPVGDEEKHENLHFKLSCVSPEIFVGHLADDGNTNGDDLQSDKEVATAHAYDCNNRITSHLPTKISIVYIAKYYWLLTEILTYNVLM
jgi:hypothetical protein